MLDNQILLINILTYRYDPVKLDRPRRHLKEVTWPFRDNFTLPILHFPIPIRTNLVENFHLYFQIVSLFANFELKISNWRVFIYWVGGILITAQMKKWKIWKISSRVPIWLSNLITPAFVSCFWEFLYFCRIFFTGKFTIIFMNLPHCIPCFLALYNFEH